MVQKIEPKLAETPARFFITIKTLTSSLAIKLAKINRNFWSYLFAIRSFCSLFVVTSMNRIPPNESRLTGLENVQFSKPLFRSGRRAKQATASDQTPLRLIAQT